MESEDTVHAVPFNRILHYSLEIFLLVPVIKSGSRNLDLCSVCGGGPQSVETSAGELFDRGGVQEQSIPRLENRAALGSKGMTQNLFIISLRASDFVPPK